MKRRITSSSKNRISSIRRSRSKRSARSPRRTAVLTGSRPPFFSSSEITIRLLTKAAPEYDILRRVRMAQRSAEGVGMTNATARPPHRRERLCQWMRGEDATCTVLFGADHATHLTGYARYFGGPSAVVVRAEGDCVLVVMQDEAPVPRRVASVDEVIGFGERGFGIDLDPPAAPPPTVSPPPSLY